MRAAGVVVGLVLAAGANATELAYHFEQVAHKVTLVHQGGEQRARVGTVAAAGDAVRTGWFAHAVVAVPERASRFAIFASTEVLLASGEPGLLLVVKQGKLEAIFDALTGREDRLVAAPGAVLAVRGTRYGLEVDRRGHSVLVVFEGTVEVRPLGEGAAPIAVGAGHLCRFAPGSGPRQEAMPRGLNEESWRRGGSNASGSSRGSQTGAQGSPGGPDQSSRRPPGGRGPR